ncbi:MAG: GIY-YIG nuclease family protein [Candidatus Pacebacteria bacterium]|nr:GIY-YIG nuclease family protein [Candidatus Paceibacterota bacterium]
MYYVYITTNKNNTTLYTGVSNTLERRMFEHIEKENPNSFTAKYNINKLVYYETFSRIKDAISAEKTIKGWKRDKKIKLIENMNPEWNDLFEE